MIRQGPLLTPIGLFCAFLCAAPAHAALIKLYDAAEPGLPQKQGWLAYHGRADLLDGASGGGVVLDTTGDPTLLAGFSNYADPSGQVLENQSFPELDAAGTVGLSFDLTLSEAEGGRGSGETPAIVGMSSDENTPELGVLLVDGKGYGIELFFSATKVRVVDADGAEVGDAVQIAGGAAFTLALLPRLTYKLFADGEELLEGGLSHYGGTGAPSNMIFIGDALDSAGTWVRLGSVTLESGFRRPMPAAAPWLLLLPGLGWLARPRGSRKGRRGTRNGYPLAGRKPDKLCGLRQRAMRAAGASEAAPFTPARARRPGAAAAAPRRPGRAPGSGR
jgi:hypothetical protein